MPNNLVTIRGGYEPETILKAPQQEGHPDDTEEKDIADYNPDVDYEGSEPKVEPVAQQQREVDPDREHAKMEKHRNGTLHQRMMPCDV